MPRTNVNDASEAIRATLDHVGIERCARAKDPCQTVRKLASAILVAGGALGAQAVSAMSCESLVTLPLPDATIMSATSIPGPSFTAPNGQTYDVPPFCKVSALSNPTPDSVINIELWMPTGGWNGRFEGTGNGGYAGNISLSVQAMMLGLKLGNAVAGTDMGTAPSTFTDADVLVGHPQKWVDFGWRSTHLMTVVSKEIIAAFYGSGPRYSYFNGCSTGGQQALMSAQRFPTDYNGILAGDPGNNRTHLHTALVWNHRALHAAPDSQIYSGQAQAISNAVVAACGVKSGSLATDPFLTDPRTCNWDPGALQCATPVSDGSCLTAGQVEAARLIYQGPIDPVTGHRIYPGSVRGGENDSLFGWAGTFTTTAEPPFDSLFKWVFGPAWPWPTFDFDQHMEEVNQVLADDLNANEADLSEFQAAGGKLLVYHGWADTLVSPQDSINYYMRVVANQGKGPNALKKTQQFYRLFMVPGMYHCCLGPGPNAFGNTDSNLNPQPPPVEDADHDALLALARWVENGIAPQKIIATKYLYDTPQLGIAMQRPICPFPQVPKYSGSGDTNVASNFFCVSSPATTSQVSAPEYLQ